MSAQMFEFDEALTELVLGYCRDRLALDPVPLDFPGIKADLDRALDGLLSEDGNDPAKVMALFEEHLAPAVISCDSPRFLSFIPAAPTKASLLFDMVVSCSSLQGTSWLEAAGAVAAENQVLALLADRAGMPAGSGGCFVSGGSAGNLSALMVARDLARHRGVDVARPLVAVSDQAHSSVDKALHVLGMEALLVPTVDCRMTGPALAAALDEAPEGAVVAVTATAGTTNAGIIDDLEEVGQVARERGLWLHVDGAYGGAGILSDRLRPQYAGLRHADSFVVDPHKWLFAPFDCAALIYRHPHLAKGVHTQDAGYLDVLHTDAPEEWNPSDYAYHLTRRARGLPLWFSLAVHGTGAYGAAIDAAVDAARLAADDIRRRPYLELIREPSLSAVLFRRVGWERDDYYRWTAQLLADQVGFVTPSVWQGETVARFAFLHPATTPEMVAEILDTMA
ncbi:MAG TPA: aminotransferase class I/II-fold pyridoxal phosphate-dependent enzyme [Acidimicrobiales bacterium]|nr:aminotransferase class I/II-fold pyridoxal phosphate-dependent enzyme [Acidimicrobiales bacterium]